MEIYRLVVGEKGNEIGHIIQSRAKSERGANIALGQHLALYAGDGWGRVEVNYTPADSTTWQTLP